MRQCGCSSNNQYCTSKHRIAMHLVRCLFYIMTFHNFSLACKHLPGRLNTAADALSRNNLLLFQAEVTQAAALPSAVPQELLDILMNDNLDWAVETWRSQFSAIYSVCSLVGSCHILIIYSVVYIMLAI